MKKSFKLILSIVVVFVFMGTLSFLIYKNNNPDKFLNEPEKVVFDFYTYYLDNIYQKINIDSPQIKLGKEGFFVLDSTEYVNFIISSGYFSQKFYENELKKIISCEKVLKEVDVKIVNDTGFYPNEFIKTDACNFVSNNQWLHSQGDELDVVTISTSTINGNTAKVLANIGYKLKNKNIENFSYPTVYLIKEGNNWKIEKIDVSLEKP